jgi:hypothetical protein
MAVLTQALGVILTSIGVMLVSVPAGLIVLGLFTIGYGILLEASNTKGTDDGSAEPGA